MSIFYIDREGELVTKTDLYEITSSTCALVALAERQTKVIEKQRSFIINRSVYEILSYSCEYYGSSLEGRMKGAKKQLGMGYKLPITIEGSQEIIIFPTTSPTRDDCSWIAIKNIDTYRAIDNCVEVHFFGGAKEIFELSIDSLENQMFRATKLMMIIRNRKS